MTVASAIGLISAEVPLFVAVKVVKIHVAVLSSEDWSTVLSINCDITTGDKCFFGYNIHNVRTNRVLKLNFFNNRYL